MKTKRKGFHIPIVWSMWGRVTVEADTEKEAIRIALDSETPLPDGTYVDESIMLDEGSTIDEWLLNEGEEASLCQGHS